MTRSIFTLFFCLSFIPLFASHNSAGEITYEQIGDKTIRATIHTYTVASSTAADRDSLQICWGDGTCEFVERTSEELLVADRKYNQYTGTHEYDDFGEFTLSMSDPNRNYAVNLIFGEQILFHIQTTFKLSSDFNVGPVFLETPNPLGYVGEPYFHLPNAWDPDGDSLSFRLVTPFADLDVPAANYSFPNEVPVNGEAFGIIEDIGLVGWVNPHFPGKFIIAFEVDEFRNGELISTTLRDMEVCIAAENLINTPPTVSVVEDFYEVTAGEIVEYEVDFNDLEDDILINATGGPLEVDNPATFDFPTGQITPPENITFTWQTSSLHARSQPYFMFFSAMDDNMEMKMGGRLVQIIVSDASTGIDDILENSGINIFPNPNYGRLKIKFENREWNEVEFILNDILGRPVWRKKLSFNSETILDFGEIQSGLYYLTITANGLFIGTKKIIIK